MIYLIWAIAAIITVIILLLFIHIISIVISLPKTGGAMFCTTHKSKIDAILDALPMNSGQRLIDLGCGDGRFLRAAVSRHKVKGTEYEVNPLARMLARIRTIGLKDAGISGRDFWHVPFKDADFIFCYLFPDLMEKLAHKAGSEMKEGARLISCNFELPGWTPERIIRAEGESNNDPIFIYRKNNSDCKQC